MCGIESAVFAQYGRQYFRIPAIAGPQFNDLHVTTQSKELQSFLWMAISVASSILLTAVGSLNRAIELGRDLGVYLRTREQEREQRNLANALNRVPPQAV
jgi:hypothetical protein